MARYTAGAKHARAARLPPSLYLLFPSLYISTEAYANLGHKLANRFEHIRRLYACKCIVTINDRLGDKRTDRNSAHASKSIVLILQ